MKVQQADKAMGCDPNYIFFLLFWYIANGCNIKIASSHWWTFDMVTFQSAIHGEEELEILIVFKTNENTETKNCVACKLESAKGF